MFSLTIFISFKWQVSGHGGAWVDHGAQDKKVGLTHGYNCLVR
jgi:hypothetical protein